MGKILINSNLSHLPFRHPLIHQDNLPCDLISIYYFKYIIFKSVFSRHTHAAGGPAHLSAGHPTQTTDLSHTVCHVQNAGSMVILTKQICTHLIKMQ